MRISDWSSDVCSSDLRKVRGIGGGAKKKGRPLARPAQAPMEEDRRRSAGDTHGQFRPHQLDAPEDVEFPDRLLVLPADLQPQRRSEEHTSELQSLMRISYAVFCLKHKKQIKQTTITRHQTNT